jgi:hypothetical protein
MGIFWDLIQQNQLNNQQKKTDSVVERLHYLERELEQTKVVLNKTLSALETHLNKDIDGD